MKKQIILAEMEKKRSPFKIIFVSDPEDDYFIIVKRISIKTGDEISKALILRTDLPQWLNQYRRENFFVKSLQCSI